MTIPVMYLVAAATAMSMHIMPINLIDARLHVHACIQESEANDDVLRLQGLKRTRHLLKTHDYLGCIALKKNKKITAITLLEKKEDDHIVMLAMDVCDASSGTILIKSLVHISDIDFDDALESRWKLAFSYFKEAYTENIE
tara:strand:+ start:2628 stop:3050 length:423 start_codon:yes stop_codon:yes gene_type:complete